MINCVKYQIKYVAQIYLGMVASIFGYGFLMVVLMGNSFALVYMAILVSLIAPVIALQTLSGIYFDIAMSYGATRKNYNTALQINKIIICVMQAALAIPFIIFVGQSSLSLSSTAILLFSFCFLASSLGDFLGIATLKFSRTVLIIVNVIFFILIFSIGGIIGYTTSSGSIDDLLEFIAHFLNTQELTLFIYVGLGFVATGTVVSFINRKLMLNISLKK